LIYLQPKQNIDTCKTTQKQRIPNMFYQPWTKILKHLLYAINLKQKKMWQK